jgi:hypothetical protein
MQESRGQEIPTMVDVQILLEAFFNMSTASVHLYDEAYWNKKWNFQALVFSPRVSQYQALHIIRHVLTEFYCVYK